MIRVMRHNIATGKTTKYAGYDGITNYIAVKFLDHHANEEAKESHCTIVPHDYELDGKRHWERILVDQNDQPVVKFFLQFEETE